MTDTVIICEKDSAQKKIADALGGNEGTFDGVSYRLVCLMGHMRELCDPDKQVDDPDQANDIKTWDLANLPWPLKDFKWKLRDIDDTRAKRLREIKKIVNYEQPDYLLIATDPDPSGEGDLIGWEVVDGIGWKGNVKRLWNESEGPKAYQKAFRNAKDIDREDKRYLTAKARQMYDFASMQLTREATLFARESGIVLPPKKAVRLGRLKSVILSYILKQTNEHNHYVKKPFWEVHYKTDNGCDFKIKDCERFDNKEKALQALKDAKSSHVVDVQHQDDYKTPPSLIDLATIGARLSKMGYASKQVLDTYQEMYEDDVVSYPRTTDKKVTVEDYQKVVDNSGQIADVLGIDKRLLSHPEPRSKYIAKSTDHGANRPGDNVPTDLTELEHKYGRCGVEIYKVVASSFLATMCEDAVYDKVTAILDNKGIFVKSKLKQKNWKEIFDDGKDEDDSEFVIPSVGDVAEPSLYEGANPRTPLPTQASLFKFLRKHDVGTGSTRLSTLSELSKNGREVIDRKGKLTLTTLGEVNAALCANSMIGDADMTKALWTRFEMYGKKELDNEHLFKIIDTFIEKDAKVYRENAENIKDLISENAMRELEKNKKNKQNYTPKTAENSFPVDYEGKTYMVRKKWGQHEFTKDEIKTIQDGGKVEVEGRGRKGKWVAKLHFGKDRDSRTGKEVYKLVAEFGGR